MKTINKTYLVISVTCALFIVGDNNYFYEAFMTLGFTFILYFINNLFNKFHHHEKEN